MKNLIRAELLKLRTTRMIYGLALAALALVPLSVFGAIVSAGKSGGGPALGTGEGIRGVMSAGSSGALTVLIIGILIMAGEFRHGTVTSTFLVSPNRGRVVAAKIATSALVGAGIAMARHKAHPRRCLRPQRRLRLAWRHRYDDDLWRRRCRSGFTDPQSDGRCGHRPRMGVGR